MYRAYHAPVRTAEGGLLRNAQGRPTNAVYIFVTMLRKLLNEHKPEFIAASFDLPGRTFRDDLASDYKANRAPMPDELAEQIPMVHAACEALGVPILTSERYEADDVIGTLAEKAAAAGFDVAIVTGDKDFFQLVRDGIRVFNPRDEGTWYDAEGVKEKFGVAPEQVVDVLALMGDTIDNIKGVPGIGEKGARELIATYGSLENLLAHAGEVKHKRYREGLLGQRRGGAAEPRAGADPHRRAGRVRRRGAAVPRRLARAVLPDLQRARVPGAREGVRADRRARSPRPTGSSTPPRTCRRWPGGCAPPAASRCACCPIGPTAMRAAIVGLAFSTAPRGTRTTCRSDTGRSSDTASLPLDGALERCGRSSRTRRSAKAGHDLKFDAIVLARHGVDAARPRPRHDARQLPDRRDAIGAPARGSRARAHQLQGADAKRTSAAAARRRCRWPTLPVEAAVDYAGERADLVGQLAPMFCELLAKDELTTVYETLELPLIPVLVAVERAGVRIDGRALAAQSQQGRAGAGAADRADLRAGRRRVQHQLAEAAGRDPVRQAAAAGAEAHRHVAGAVDGGRSARGAGAGPRPAAADPRMARPDEAEGHLHRRAAAARATRRPAACTPASTRRSRRPAA